MKKILSFFLVAIMVVVCTCPICADGDERRVLVAQCSGSDVYLSKTGEHIEIYERYDFGSFPGDSYTVTSSMTTSVSINASLNIIEAFLSIGIQNNYTTSDSVGQTATNHGSSYSRAALWVSYDDYSVTELNYIGNGTCEVLYSSAKVPVYHIYGFENSY